MTLPSSLSSSTSKFLSEFLSSTGEALVNLKAFSDNQFDFFSYLAVFLVALIGIIVCVYMGHQQHLQMEATKRETRRAMEGDEKV